MKKKILYSLLVGVFGVIVLVGCGSSSNKVTCTGEVLEEGEKIGTAEVVADFDGSDKIKSVTASMIFDSEEVASQAYYFLTMDTSSSVESNNKLDAKLDGKKITISNYEVLAGATNDKLSKSEFIEAMEANPTVNVVCK